MEYNVKLLDSEETWLTGGERSHRNPLMLVLVRAHPYNGRQVDSRSLVR